MDSTKKMVFFSNLCNVKWKVKKMMFLVTCVM